MYTTTPVPFIQTTSSVDLNPPFSSGKPPASRAYSISEGIAPFEHETNQTDSQDLTHTNPLLTRTRRDANHQHADHPSSSAPSESESASRARRDVAGNQEIDHGRLHPGETTTHFQHDGNLVPDRLSTSALLRILHARVLVEQNDAPYVIDENEEVGSPPSYTSHPFPRL